MDYRNALTTPAALGEGACGIALRGATMILATLALLGMLMGTTFVSSVIEASQSVGAGEDVQLMPAKEPGDTM